MVALGDGVEAAQFGPTSCRHRLSLALVVALAVAGATDSRAIVGLIRRVGLVVEMPASAMRPAPGEPRR